MSRVPLPSPPANSPGAGPSEALVAPLGDPLVDIRDLHFGYRRGGHEVPVLRGVNLRVERGEYVGILGPSGSGKSTLFYIIGCLLRAERGEVRIDGQELRGMREAEMAYLRNEKIGFVFQQFHLLPGLSVRENILLPAEYPLEKPSQLEALRPRAEELIERLGLREVASHRPNQLSGGQQQRVAIARALLRDTQLILADEPTGNLDSKTAAEVLHLLDELHAAGRTIVMITHDAEVARRCQRTVRMRDGEVVSPADAGAVPGAARGAETDAPNLAVGVLDPAPSLAEAPAARTEHSVDTTDLRYIRIGQSSPTRPIVRASRAAELLRKSLPLASANLRRNKTKTFLTMLGVIVGIAAVQAMITFGDFVKARVLESYSELGVDRVSISGYPNWRRKATDAVVANFTQFSVKRDLVPLMAIFPDFVRASPLLRSWQGSVNFAGRSMTDNVRLLGVSEDYISMQKRTVSQGRNFSRYNIERQDPVCLVGPEIIARVYPDRPALGTILFLTTMSAGSGFPCRVIGVLNYTKGGNDWSKPNSEVLMPYTYFQSVVPGWQGGIHDMQLESRPGSDIEALSKGVKAYFQLKYGAAGQFGVDEGAIVLEQMKKFLNLFTLLLTSIAALSLIIGGIGINNMMLVSVSERLREIGIRKALGATNASVRYQLLTESVLICLVAGAVGVVLAFTGYELIIFVASKFVSKVQFEWIFNVWAFAASVVSIAVVGVASGIVPALKAERIQVIEALRSE